MYYPQLEDYIQLTNGISAEICEELLEDLSEAHWENHGWSQSYAGPQDPHIAHSTRDQNERLISPVSKAIAAYTRRHAYTDSKFTQGELVSRFSGIRFNRYDEGSSMAKHYDHIHDLFPSKEGARAGIPTLSIIGCLNSDYGGGELSFFSGEVKFKLEAGDICVFPSCYLFPHEVLPVTSGSRYSFVSWGT